MTDNTLDPSTVASIPSDATYAADEAAAVAAGNGPLAAAESAEQSDVDAAKWRANNLT